MNFFSLFKRKLIYNFTKKYNVDDDDFKNKSLDFLFNYYGSDKAEYFKIKRSPGHGFSQIYENQLKNFKGKNLNILEIGSYAGASAAAFIKFFENSKVFCLDINISNFKYKSKRIEVFGTDIKNKKKINKILKSISINHKFQKFDLIIDDGSHQLSDILYGLKYFFNYLTDSGIYIIEDFKHPNYYKYNRDIDHILIDEVLENLEKKKLFRSFYLDKKDQTIFFEKIKKIEIFKGNLKDSDICFIKR